MLAGDEAAFAEFFDANFPRLCRFVLVRVGPSEAAKDIAQNTLVIACRKLHTWRGEAALFSWLTTICRHEIGAFVARARRESAMAIAEDEPEIRAHLETLTADAASRPDRALEAAEIGRLVQLTLDYLPGRYGDVLEWKYLLGWSVAEIADRLGVSQKAVESLLTRAREAFREAFQRDQYLTTTVKGLRP